MRYLITSILILFSFNVIVGQTKTNLFEYNKETEKVAVVVRKQKIDSVTIFEKIVIEGYDSKVPFYSYTNLRKEKPPFVILLHGLGDTKDDWVYPSEPYLEWSRNITSIKDSLLTLGYSIIIPDAKFHGERSYELGFRPPESLPPVISRNEKDSKLFETLMTSTVKDMKIIMDYIQSRSTDPDQSFSVIGYSMGGSLAILLSIFDDRISSVVGCVPPINLPARGLEAFNWSEEVLQGQLDITPMKYAELQKSPIMLLMGRNDFYTTEEEVSNFFENIPIKEKELKYFDSGHILPNHYKLDAIRWITKHSHTSN
ncbi:MAG: alpha/beta hydrolase [Eudoraea sp.]|nr:alpha/beta hydrolase [Eudoraea sp.]